MPIDATGSDLDNNLGRDLDSATGDTGRDTDGDTGSDTGIKCDLVIPFYFYYNYYKLNSYNKYLNTI
jgi:hypothetical protein